jgi:hypothetical protein
VLCIVFYSVKKEEKEEELRERERRGHLSGYNINITNGFIN